MSNYWQEYERQKRELQQQNLSPKEYEEMIKKVVNKIERKKNNDRK